MVLSACDVAICRNVSLPVRLADAKSTSKFIILSMMTWRKFVQVLAYMDENGRLTVKSVGSVVSQLRVQPTVGLYRKARSFANAFTASIAVWLDESLPDSLEQGQPLSHWLKLTISTPLETDN